IGHAWPLTQGDAKTRGRKRTARTHIYATDRGAKGARPVRNRRAHKASVGRTPRTTPFVLDKYLSLAGYWRNGRMILLRTPDSGPLATPSPSSPTYPPKLIASPA